MFKDDRIDNDTKLVDTVMRDFFKMNKKSEPKEKENK
jgi:hypothetical protein